MNDFINIDKLDQKQHQALVCMFFAMLPSSDERYKKRKEYWEVLQIKFGKKSATYKLSKDTFDFYFDNGRKGWSDSRSLKTRGAEYQLVYDEFKDYDISVIEDAVERIINLYKEETNTFISMKCQKPDMVHAILRGEKEIAIDGVYTLQEDLTIGKLVFVTLGGDKGRKEVDWVPGFFGIAHITKEPYDFGYDGNDKYFKFNICMDCCFKDVYKREAFMYYIEAFDARYIGPELTRDPTQAITSLSEKKAVAVIRAVLDNEPELLNIFKNIFSGDFIERVLGAVRVLIPIEAEFGETTEQLLSNLEPNVDIERYVQDNKKEFSKNKIIFGAPGTGKSFALNEEKADLLKGSSNFERVTFHPDYSYANFVGCYKPVPGKENTPIKYEYVPGPFIRTLVNAIIDKDNLVFTPHLLIIEEINRANVAAVFGDMFQLLDRSENGESEYAINTSEDLRKYLAKEDVLGGTPSDYATIRIPNNMFIWATMNSADQGVFPMDTAFKRRWDFTYLGIDNKEEQISEKYVVLGEGNDSRTVEWNSLRKAINDELITYKINEDKLMGPFFISKKLLPEGETIDSESFKAVFKNKVIMYLFEDAARSRRNDLFSGCEENSKNQYSKIIKEFDSKGIFIFNNNIIKRLTEAEGAIKQ